jgi:hypothetical protein
VNYRSHQKTTADTKVSKRESEMPPPSLSKDDVGTLADVRRNIYTNSVVGLGELLMNKRSVDVVEFC